MVKIQFGYVSNVKIVHVHKEKISTISGNVAFRHKFVPLCNHANRADRIPRVLHRSRNGAHMRRLARRPWTHPVYILNAEIAVTKWPTKYAKRANDDRISVHDRAKHCPLSRRLWPYARIFSARRMRSRHREENCEREISVEGNVNKAIGGDRKKKEYGEIERAHIYDRRIADQVAFKIDPVIRNREDPLTRNSTESCASLPSRFAVVCACFVTFLSCTTFDERYIRMVRDICMIHWFMRIAYVAPIPDVFQRAYELLAISYERAMEIDTSMISIADVPGDAMQCRTYIQNRSAFIYLGYCAITEIIQS